MRTTHGSSVAITLGERLVVVAVELLEAIVEVLEWIGRLPLPSDGWRRKAVAENVEDLAAAVAIREYKERYRGLCRCNGLILE
jgi:hypothetical protein